MPPSQAAIRFLLTLAISFPAVAVALEKPARQDVDGKIEWVYDYEEGKRLGRSSGKPLFVVFRCER